MVSDLLGEFREGKGHLQTCAKWDHATRSGEGGERGGGGGIQFLGFLFCSSSKKKKRGIHNRLSVS